jgi:hypothetical protein
LLKVEAATAAQMELSVAEEQTHHAAVIVAQVSSSNQLNQPNQSGGSVKRLCPSNLTPHECA